MKRNNGMGSATSVVTQSDDFPKPTGPMSIADVHLAPGHLIRRAQQIAVAIFFDEFADYSITPIQYAALVAIQERPGMTQAALVNLIAIDRSTIGALLKNMEGKDLIRRVTPKENKRAKELYINKKGKQLLERTRDNIYQVQQRILEPLNDEEKKVFMSLLSRLIHINNRFSRAPLKSLVDE